MSASPDNLTVCIGGGPAGLTAAYELARAGWPVLVLEADGRQVGGIARTVERQGLRFDIGGHRFFSKSPEIVELWREVLGEDLLTRRRVSRIYFGGKFYPYPLDALSALANLGPIEAARCLLSYIRARVKPVRRPRSFEEWVSNQFGARLYTLFFKTYTEKVWGMKCSQISADWAAQRIKGLSLGVAMRGALRRMLGMAQPQGVKTLIETFYYPRLGPGMMWERMARRIGELGGEVRLGCPAEGLSCDAASGLWSVRCMDGTQVQARHVISTMPLRELAHAVEGAPAQVLAAADSLLYRDFLLVALVLRDRGQFDDNWLYIHDPSVKVGRIQNFKAWSPEMVSDPELVCYGMEYFSFEHEAMWNRSDEELIAQAAGELEAIGIGRATDVLSGYVVRQPKAYPVYDHGYRDAVGLLRGWLERECPGLQVAGRNGMHKYNNQDHSMMTALLAARNVLGGRRRYDVWNVNQDAEYHEQEAQDEGGRLVPLSV